MNILWLVYLTWTTPPLRSGPKTLRRCILTRMQPTTLIISLNDVKRLPRRKPASDRTRQNQRVLSDHVDGNWWSLTDSNR
jgi:hypothetical protein